MRAVLRWIRSDRRSYRRNVGALADDEAARGEVLGIVRDRSNVLVARRKIDAGVAIGVSDGAARPKGIPDWIGICYPRSIEMIEIASPISNRRTSAHLLLSFSMMLIAVSGPVTAAS